MKPRSRPRSLPRRAVIGAGLLLAGAWAPTPAEAAQARPAVSPAAVLSIARAELARNVREVPMGSNRGVRIEMYELAVPNEREYPAPWCAYFVSWVALQAGRPLGPDGLGFSSVDRLHLWAKRTGRWTHRPAPGDLIVFDEHVGIVETVRGRALTTIEGNRSDRVMRVSHQTSDAEGYAVLPPPSVLDAQVVGYANGNPLTAAAPAR